MKPLWKISVATSAEAEEAVTELLGSLTGKAAAGYYNLESRVSIVSVFSDKPFPKGIREKISAGLKQITGCGLDVGTGKIEIGRVKREDWAESWKKHFKPINIGDLLLVKASWHKRKPRKNQKLVVLDPGLSFGTGQHPTTSFCLSQIAKAAGGRARKSFLDIGTGSGILAIAAVKLGFKPVEAFDFDPESVRVAKANARVNRVSGQLKIFRGDVTKLPMKSKKQFDLVCANLISNLLVAEKKKIAARVKPDGVLVLAGILAVEFVEVQRAFEDCGLKLVASKTEKEWCSGAFRFLKK
ncbi:MAG TPA: 50S ribosomal protein L11 methyltransferase [Candidatus Sulfotelmatobacter sp.]|nr:50S ribosomal protein L11 methyltransferase [Candidatus Sulfotelmatobacter sp.]